MSLPPIEIPFVPLGHDQVMSAFTSIQSAAVATAKTVALATNVTIAALNKEAQAYANLAKLRVSGAEVGRAAANVDVRSAQVSADAAVKGYERQLKALADLDEARARAVRGLAATTNSGALGSSGTASGASNAGGPSKMLDFGAGVFKSAIDLAADSLKVFAGFVLNDVIGAQLKRSVTAAQIANRMEGIAGDKVLGTLNGLDVAFASIDPKKIETTFAAAVDKTHDFADAQEVASLALKAGQGLGMDPEKIAGLFADKKGELAGLSKEEFSGYISALVNKTKSAGGDMKLEELSKLSNQMTTMVGRFNDVNASPNQKAATDLGITGLVVNAAGGMKSGKAAYTGLENLLKDLEANNKTGATAGMFKTGTQFNDLRNTIPLLLKSVGGDLSKLGKDPGGLLGSAKFNETGLGFLRALDLERTYQFGEKEAKGGGEAAVKSKLTEMMDAAPDAGALDKLNDKVAKEPAVELEQAFRALKVAIASELVPVIKNDIIPAVGKLDFAALAKTVVDVIGVLGMFGKGLASVVYQIMELTGMGSDETRHKLGVLSGDIVEKKEVNGREADKLLYGDKTGTGLDVLNKPSFDDNSDPRDKQNQKNVIKGRMPWLADMMGGLSTSEHVKADPMAGLKSQWGAQAGAGAGGGQVAVDDASAAKIGAAVGAAINKAQSLTGPQTPMSDPARLNP